MFSFFRTITFLGACSAYEPHTGNPYHGRMVNSLVGVSSCYFIKMGAAYYTTPRNLGIFPLLYSAYVDEINKETGAQVKTMFDTFDIEYA